jgi:hypothetical protein
MRGGENNRAFFCPQLVVLYESLYRRLVMDNLDIEVLDPRDVDLGMEWDSEEPEMDVSELFDDPEKF